MLENVRNSYDIILKYIKKYEEKNKGDTVSFKNF